MEPSRSRYAVIDVEGNGQQPAEIVEVAVTPVDGGTVGLPVCWLVKPATPINSVVASRVHGITDADVADAPPFEEIAPELMAVLVGRTPVAHNAHVEHRVLGRHLPDWQPTTMLDTLRLAKHVWPCLAGYSLDHLLAHAKITVDTRYGKRHRAAWDSYATARLFCAMTAGLDVDLTEVGCLPALAADRGRGARR